jgi:hypothetical protein
MEIAIYRIIKPRIIDEPFRHCSVLTSLYKIPFFPKTDQIKKLPDWNPGTLNLLV